MFNLLLKKKLSWALPQIMGVSGSINCPYSLNFSFSDKEHFQPSARETIVPGNVSQGFTSGNFGLLSMKNMLNGIYERKRDFDSGVAF